ncbi:hypothetical protein CTI12_AA074580 [Artemisia annua]|uniref:Leucine-rich repeat domain, L domain-like protein n=1 Tax=Artemisia annua TaxID=35608 RepID=A0A2U1Q4Y5_ARTAN|nr:hypothetical protein CTI12_AA074580 [Artemisia annua]
MGAYVTDKNNRIHCIPQPGLPDDCLKLIFDKLNEKEDRDSFGLTCHNFLDIQNSCRNKHLDFKSSYSKNDCENHHDSPTRCRSKKNHDSPIQLINRFHHLNFSLPLTSCDELLRLFHRFNHIESLSLTNGDRLFDSSIKKLQIYLCRLHSLDLSGCSYLTDKGLTTAASSCPLLSVIRLRDCNSITDKGLKFLTKFCKYLKQVDLSGCSNITDTGIGYINQNCRQLRALRISGCLKILGVGFLGFSRSLVSLEAERCMLDSAGLLQYYVELESKWNLSSCEKIGISGWTTIGLYCQNLETIHVNQEFNMLNDKLVDANLIALSHCRRLSVIYMPIWWCGQQRSPREIRDVMSKDVKIIEYKKQCPTNSRSISIKILKIGGRYIDVHSDTIMNIAKGCPLLQEWNLSSCEKIDISGWKSIGLYCQNLKTIHVNFHERFNMFNNELMDARLIALSHCRRLAVIYMPIWWSGRKCSPHEIRELEFTI